MEGKIAINDLDMIDVINLIRRKKKKCIALTLNDFDDLLKEKIPEELYFYVRKSFLDNINDLERALLRNIFSGDVEGSGIF